jgi:hypothetical protein
MALADGGNDHTRIPHAVRAMKTAVGIPPMPPTIDIHRRKALKKVQNPAVAPIR